jgi:hypothetical protein
MKHASTSDEEFIEQTIVRVSREVAELLGRVDSDARRASLKWRWATLDSLARTQDSLARSKRLRSNAAAR